MTTTTLAKDGFVWRRGMTSNMGAWTLINPEGFMVAHVYQGNDRTWCSVDDDGTVVSEHAHTCCDALRAADEEMRPCAWIDPHPTRGIVGCDNERKHGSVYCTIHTIRATTIGIVR